MTISNFERLSRDIVLRDILGLSLLLSLPVRCLQRCHCIVMFIIAIVFYYITEYICQVILVNTIAVHYIHQCYCYFHHYVSRMDKIRNEYIRGTARVGRFWEKTREARLRGYGHLRRKDDGYIRRRMLRMELPGKRKRGRPKRMFMGVVSFTTHMALVEVTGEDAEYRTNGDVKSSVSIPDGRRRKKNDY